MSILKVIEVMSNSTTSWEDAAQQAVAEASKTVKNIRSVYIHEQTATVADGKITEFRVNVKLTFEIQHSDKI
jgi:dodecin